MQTIRIVFTGHIDHGKSTLIGRLLCDSKAIPVDRVDEIKRLSEQEGKETDYSYITDHLEEERSEGKTIDTTRFYFRTEHAAYTIIDAPGHNEYIRNMVTGAAGADAAVIVVDMTEGIQEQTLRHIHFLELLGFTEGIAVFNKADAVSYDEKNYYLLKELFLQMIKDSKIQVKSFIPVSARCGDNIVNHSASMSWYRGNTLLEEFESLHIPDRKNSETRFSVQCTYKKNDVLWHLGLLHSGMLEAGQQVLCYPGQKTAIICRMQNGFETADTITAGQSAAVVLKEFECNRGAVFTSVISSGEYTDHFEAVIFWLSDEPLKKDRISVRLGLQQTPVKSITLNERYNSETLECLEENAETLYNSEFARCHIEFHDSLFLDLKEQGEFSRFVLFQDGDICAGGKITS